MTYFKHKMSNIDYDLRFANDLLKELCCFKTHGSEKSVFDVLLSRNSKDVNAITNAVSEECIYRIKIIQLISSKNELLPDYDFNKVLNSIFPDEESELNNEVSRFAFLLDLLFIAQFYLDFYGNPILQLNAVEYRKKSKGDSSTNNNGLYVYSDEELYYLVKPVDRIKELLTLAKALENKKAELTFKFDKNMLFGNEDFVQNIELTYDYNQSVIERLAFDLFQKWASMNRIPIDNECNDATSTFNIAFENSVTYNAHVYLSIAEGKYCEFTSSYLLDMLKIVKANTYTSKQKRIDYFNKEVSLVLLDYINDNTDTSIEEKEKYQLIYLVLRLKGLIYDNEKFNPNEKFSNNKMYYIRDLIKK